VANRGRPCSGREGGSVRRVVRRSVVKPDEPFIEGEDRQGPDDEMELVHIDGVSADEAVRMRSGDQVVAEKVAPHGYFVLAVVLPADPLAALEASFGDALTRQ
jgi:hypothetical protein